MTLPANVEPGTYVIDPSHTEIGFTTRHAMVTKVRGSFSSFSGEIVLADDLKASSTTAKIDTASITTRNDDRDAHVKSGEFFDVDNFPEITYISRSVVPSDDGFTLEGDLTIKGVTQPVTLDVESMGSAKDPFGNTRVGFSAETVINRKDFGLVWNATLETGGVLVSDKVTLSLDISAIKS